jgi:hypothetical protein
MEHYIREVNRDLFKIFRRNETLARHGNFLSEAIPTKSDPLFKAAEINFIGNQ